MRSQRDDGSSLTDEAIVPATLSACDLTGFQRFKVEVWIDHYAQDRMVTVKYKKRGDVRMTEYDMLMDMLLGP